MEADIKACTGCSTTKPLSAFSIRTSDGKHLSRCRACQVESARRSNAANPERAVKRVSDWNANNQDRRREIARNWASKNLPAVVAQTMKRRAGELNATPPWADLDAIRAVYLKAAEMRRAGMTVDVDHIFPLRGKLVSGLHAADNLQIIPSLTNKRKGNRVDVDALPIAVLELA